MPIQTLSRLDLDRVHGAAGGAILGGIGQAASGVMGGLGSLFQGIGSLKVAKAQANAIKAGAGGAGPSGGDPGAAGPAMAAASAPGAPVGGGGDPLTRITTNVSIA